nr:tRNA (adenosine(37)-N6)-threonylcarbamoyltransferase complex dimerization subunit type 1 TsaB [Amylibacter sp.]
MPPKPLILAFDTAAAHCAAVLFQGDTVLSCAIEPMHKGQAEQLFPILHRVLADAGHDWHNLSAIAVGIGPGNFTGIRISVAAARGLSLSLGLPAIGISRLEAIAYGTESKQIAVVDARQNRMYHQRFDAGTPQTDVALSDVADFPTDLPFVSDAPIDLPRLTQITPEHLLQNMAILASQRFGTDQPRPAPLYVRAPDAALPSEQPPLILP